MLRSLIANRWQVRNFCFFDAKISDKYGKKCCKYNQDGLPMPEDKAKQLLTELSTFLKGWKLRQESKRLMKYFYVEDYPSALNYITRVIEIDANQFKQCPSYHVTNGEILCLELYSISLQGLSMVDFQLAMRINNLNHSKYGLLELEDENNYKKQFNKVRMQRESKRIQAMLAQDQKNWKNNQKSVQPEKQKSDLVKD